MALEVDFSTAPWIRGPDHPIDLNVSTDVAYTPYDTRWFDRPLIDVIGDVARRLPAQIALDDGVTRLTYSQLYGLACGLGHEIRRIGLPPGPIGINVSDDAFYVVAMLGCLAAGHPFLLLSQDSPPDYNRRLIEAAGLQALVVNASGGRNNAMADGPRLISIEPILMTAGDRAAGPAGRLDPDEPAVILSTSGSTGVPKMIAWSQRSVQRRAAGNIRRTRYGENDRILILGAPAAAASAARRITCLLAGATLHVVDVPRAGMGGILKVLRDHRITVMQSTVSLVKALCQLDDARAYLASLRLVRAGGEMLLRRDLKQIRSVLPPGCLFGYALNSTETAVAAWFVPEQDDHDPVRVAAGYLGPEVEALVLDEDGRPCPPGEIGELIVRSPSVSLGEWAHGRLMPDRFHRDLNDPEKRIYRTGDMVRIFPDRVVVVHGRKDRMIKIRGQRVEPGLVEASIRDVPGVADAVVAARQTGGDTRIYGFIVPARGAADGLIAAVQSALKASLPSYMWPSDIRRVEALPSNSGGKVDTRALLALIGEDDVPAAPVVASDKVATLRPSEKAREMVADAWRMAFGGQRQEPALGFDAAGGDSLKFMQIVFRLEQLSKKTLPLSAFDISMTQDDMARSLDVLLGGGVAPRREGRRVFMFPGVGGDEPRLLQFRKGCAPDLSIINLDYGEWPEWVGPDAGFEAVLDRLAADVEALAPVGPLSLAGYSLGGHVAVAIAAKLHAAGRQIDNILILDSDSPMPDVAADAEPEPRAPATLRQELTMWRAAHERGEGAFVAARMATRRLLSPRWAPLLRWLARHRRAILRGRIDFYITFHLQRSLLLQLTAAWRRRLRNFPRLAIPITLFLVDRPGDEVARDVGWRNHFPAVTVVRVGGDHFTMLDPPHLANLCARFRAACGAADAGERAVS